MGTLCDPMIPLYKGKQNYQFLNESFINLYMQVSMDVLRP